MTGNKYLKDFDHESLCNHRKQGFVYLDILEMPRQILYVKIAIMYWGLYCVSFVGNKNSKFTDSKFKTF